MPVARFTLGRGAYSPTLAAKLLRLEAPETRSAHVRRWAFGYRRGQTQYPGAIAVDRFSRSSETISFLELIELAYISAMLQAGVSWPKVHAAMRVAARMFPGVSHPFAHRDWFADPGGIYLRLGRDRGEPALVEMAGDAQYAIEGLLSRYLHQIHFDEETGVASCWAPLGLARPVLVDPLRAFGLPIVTSGVRTDVLAEHFLAGDRIEDIAGWYGVKEGEVEAALEFENRISGVAA